MQSPQLKYIKFIAGLFFITLFLSGCQFLDSLDSYLDTTLTAPQKAQDAVDQLNQSTQKRLQLIDTLETENPKKEKVDTLNTAEQNTQIEISSKETSSTASGKTTMNAAPNSLENLYDSLNQSTETYNQKLEEVIDYDN